MHELYEFRGRRKDGGSILVGVAGSIAKLDGRKVLMLGSNSYLGLTNHPEIKQEIRATDVMSEVRTYWDKRLASHASLLDKVNKGRTSGGS